VGRILKVEAARCAAGKLDSNALAAVRVELLELKGLSIDAECNFRVQLADDHLHKLIAKQCGNPRLAVEVLRYLFLFKALRNISQVCDSWTRCRQAEDIQELLQIVRWLAIGDPKRAAKAVDRHVRSVAKTISEIAFSPTIRPKVTR
jgi:DNA-binding GntR family transcriptional regulator